MTFYLQAFALAAFAVVMAAAAFEDFRRLVIPNRLPIVLCALWPIYFYLVAGLAWYGALVAIGCTAAVFVGGAVLFAFGKLGGGDVKLLAAATLWAGPAGTPTLLVLTALLGGVLALFLLLLDYLCRSANAAKVSSRLSAIFPHLPFGSRIAQFARSTFDQRPEPVKRGLAMPVPYGVAIAAAALFVTLPPYFG